MSGPQLKGWRAYDREYGLGDLLEVIGVLGTMIASAAGAKNMKPGDVVPYFKEARRGQTPEEMLAIFNGATRRNQGAA